MPTGDMSGVHLPILFHAVLPFYVSRRRARASSSTYLPHVFLFCTPAVAVFDIYHIHVGRAPCLPPAHPTYTCSSSGRTAGGGAIAQRVSSSTRLPHVVYIAMLEERQHKLSCYQNIINVMSKHERHEYQHEQHKTFPLSMRNEEEDVNECRARLP